MQTVVNSQRSRTSSFTSGIPQGSILDPILFLLYTADIELAEKHGINFHSYADDTELYVHCKAHDAAVTCTRVVSCIRDIDNWIESNQLKLNPDKTQFIVLGSKQQLAKVNCDSICLGNVDMPFSPKVNCLGIILDAELTMVQHMRGVTGRCFYQLKKICAIRKSLTVETAKRLVHAFVNSRLDYCNSVLQGVSVVHLQKLQVIQNGAARIDARKGNSIRSCLQSEMNYTGCPSYREFTSSSPCLFTKSTLHGSIVHC